MAREKRKQRKNSQNRNGQLSPETYIRKKARNLPIKQCYIGSGWDETGMTNVFVARAHKNENVTVGVYLVDLYCLGIKDAFYYFNIPEYKLQEMISQSNMVKCDYDLVHNIVYGAKQYEEKLGFEPHKNWGIAQYILEPENENSLERDIEFGLDGEPHFMAGPNDDDHFINRVIRTLEKNVGTGNFHFTIPQSQFSSGFGESYEDDF